MDPRTRYVSPNSAALLAALSTLILASPADTALRVWGTENAADAANEPTDDPGDPWTETDANDEIAINLAPGDTLYLATLNDQDPARNKFWSVQLQGPGVDDLAFATPPANGGFDGFQTDDDSTPVGKAFVGLTLAPNFKRWDLRFSPQPRWERLELRPFLGVNGNIKVIANSLCTNANVGSVDLTLADTSFDSPTGVKGAPQFTEFWVFPRSHPADVTVAPTVVASPGAGDWDAEFVSTDPTGETHPVGVYFSGKNGSPNVFDRFDFAFSMLGSADTIYDAFVFDATSGSYAPYTLDLSSPQVPALPRAAFMLLALALAAGGLLTLRRRAAD